MRVNANICCAFHFLPPCFLNGLLQLHWAHSSWCLVLPLLRWILKTIKEIRNWYFSVHLIAFTVLIRLLRDLWKLFHALYLGILYSSFHLESLDLLYVVSLFLSFSLVSLSYDFHYFCWNPFFEFIRFCWFLVVPSALASRCLGKVFCKICWSCWWR